MTSGAAPASIGQRLLAMIGHYRPDHGALNCPVLCRLRGPLDTEALRQALADVTAAHEALRTTFTGRGRALRQVVHEPREIPLTEPDGGVAEELGRPIDVREWPTRAVLWRDGPDDHTLCWNMHHLVSDAWSAGIIFDALCDAYGAARGLPTEPARPTWQYRDFVRWQYEQCDGDGLDRHRAYWADRLSGLQLPRLPYTESGGSGGVVGADLDAEVMAGLRRVAKEQRTTLFCVMLALYYAVLRQLTGQDDLAVASMFANRTRPETAATVGFLANMVVLRTAAGPRDTFPALVRATHATVAGALAYQEQPYQTLPMDRAEPGGGRADDVVFQMMTEIGYSRTVAGLDVELLVPEDIGSRFEVELALVPRGDGMRAALFHTARLSPETAADLVERYESAAAAVAGGAEVPLAYLGV